MRFHYVNSIAAIKYEIDLLESRLCEDSHAFWLHIDGDKLTKCIDLLESMNHAISTEEETS